jgi:hypothetical protein
MINKPENLILSIHKPLIKITILIILFHFSVRCIAETLTSTFSFDGAMNAQVSQNLVKDFSYSTTYNGGQKFDHRIQTGFPVLFPVAVVFSLFGETFESGLIINLIYIVFLLLSIIYLLRVCLKVNELLILLFIMLFYSTPKLFDYGFGLYGEIPTLFYLILFFIFFYKYIESKKTSFLIIAGVIFSFGYLTKTIILITTPSLILVLIMEIIRNKNIKNLLEFLWNFGLGFFTPFIAFELFKLISLGNLNDYFSWWSLQLNGIFQQAGFSSGFNDTTGIFSKFKTHLNILSSETQLSTTVIMLFLLLIIGLFFLLAKYQFMNKQNYLVKLISLPKTKLMVLISGTALTYCFWWIFITPSQKAWYRRIINGYILMEISIIFILYFITIIINNHRTVYIKFSKIKIPLSILLISIFTIPIINSKHPVILFSDSEEKVAVKEASDFINKLPKDSVFYGYGWWQSPVLAFEANKNLLDLNDDFEMYIPGQKFNKFLVVDSYAYSNSNQEYKEILSNFEYQLLFYNNEYLIYELIERNFPRYDPFLLTEKSSVKMKYIDFSKEDVYGIFRNIYSDEFAGPGKWAKMYSGYLLNYDNEKEIHFTIWVPDLKSYISHPLILRVFTNNELLKSIDIKQSGFLDFSIPITPTSSNTMEISLYLNSKISTKNDPRELSFRIINIGLR